MKLNPLSQPAGVDGLTIRPAVLEDVQKIHDLLAYFAARRLLLPRPQLDLIERIANFRIAVLNGTFAGCVALRNYGSELYEVRSLAVSPELHGRGIASKLVQSQIDGLRKREVPSRLFSLTCRARFFTRLGFQIVDKNLFPEKIWSDCEQCPKKDCCDEIAVLLPLNP